MNKIPSFHPNFRQRQGGFTTVMSAVLVGLPMMAMLMIHYAYVVTEQGYMAKAQNAGGKSDLINKATNTYMSTAYLVLTDSTPDAEVQKMIAAGNLPDWVANVKRIGDPAGADYNLCPAHDCIRITTADLRQAGLPSIGTTDTDVYGNSFDIIIRRTGTPGFYDLGAIIATSGTFKRVNEGPQPNLTDLWTAVGVVGTDGAITARATQSHVNGGYTGSIGDLAAFGIGDKENNKVGWFAKASDWPNIKSEGQLVTKAGYLSSAWASYVKRDGTTPFTGPVNFGGNVYGNLKKVNMGDLCDGDAGSPDTTDYTGKTAYTQDGQLTTCRKINVTTPSGPDNRARWAKATPGYLTNSDLIAGVLDGALSSQMLIYLGPEWDGQPIGWKPIRFLIKRVPQGGLVTIPPVSGDANVGPVIKVPVTDPKGESAVVIVEDFGGQLRMVGDGPYRIVDPATYQPVRWYSTKAANLPNSRNTPASIVPDNGYPPKNWVFWEWVFAADGLSFSAYASTPLTLLDGDHNLQAGTATVTVPATCPTCSPVTVTVDGGKIQGTTYTPQSYSLRYAWNSNYYGQICHWQTGQCLN
ncbi:MAG: hypothetical protein M0Z99_13340 [Betaproteobacteria bacterium]|nr:hypothetical protein [Betaproteobacteria bacterium]